MRTISSGEFRSIESLQAANVIPPGYEIAPDGTDKRPGTIGHGFGGEALVCLLPDDDGLWFEKAAKAKNSDAYISRTE